MKGKRSVVKLAAQAANRAAGSRHQRRMKKAELRKIIKEAMK